MFALILILLHRLMRFDVPESVDFDRVLNTQHQLQIRIHLDENCFIDFVQLSVAAAPHNNSFLSLPHRVVKALTMLSTYIHERRVL